MSRAAEIEEERVHFKNVIAAFRNYSQHSLAVNNRRRKDLCGLPQEDQELLNRLGHRQKLADVDMAIQRNANFIELIIANPEIFGHDLHDAHAEDESHLGDDSNDNRDTSHGAQKIVQDSPAQELPAAQGHGRSPSHTHSHTLHTRVGHVAAPQRRYQPTESDMDKLRSTLKQFVRDWSEEGTKEREACYGPMKDALIAHFSEVPPEKRKLLRVLVPGAGLCRLAFDVASLGFSCQGNEFSHYMLLASYLILNRTHAVNEYTIFPYIHSFSNIRNREAMLRAVRIPDILPSSLPAGSDFSLVAGDFEEIYGGIHDGDSQEPHFGPWDAILTCFFLDTAKNVVNYLRIIHRILAPGGIWINIGPLLWHFENNCTNDPSVELDLQEVKVAAQSIGFRIADERTIDTTYASNPQGMLSYVYKAAFWTAMKEM